MTEKEELTPEELKKMAYSMGMRLKNQGLDGETIYARLEKQGIPEDMAKEVVHDILTERKRDVIKQAEPVYNFALIRIGIGLAVGLLTYLLTNIVILPIAIIAGGVVAALMAKKKMEE
ncbi:hypothetical protein [Chryseolinea lacunae]|uniref:DUF4342 domain-containing protein n=1 Tax=Chryseolinea lacunae TaxID=2801331 RepID=A0ABS1KWB2_9BACT|nr:hypothetical protein [Chryseolinea lacunae]MBL0743730.1 hypothetical protein [Chryseolinea lacunae]